MSGPAPSPPHLDSGPLGRLPKVALRQARLAERLARSEPDAGPRAVLGWLADRLGPDVEFGRPEVARRAAGLGRPGLVGQWGWPRLATRVGVGIEAPLVHAVADRLLGYDRPPGEEGLQVTPVERGILAFVLAESLARLADGPGPLGPWDLVLDRVGTEAFDAEDLGEILTLRWPIRIGPTAASARLWVPEGLVARWLEAAPAPSPAALSSIDRFAGLVGHWHVEVERIDLPGGLSTLRVGHVLPLGALGGTPRSPSGPVALALGDSAGRSWFLAEPVPDSAGSRIRLVSPLRRERTTREAIPVNPPPTPTPSPADPSPAELPVTVVVELGRINLPLRRLADLRPGDVVELGRHAREPVELTSGGRLVARGELVQVDAGLGVRITSLFF